MLLVNECVTECVYVLTETNWPLSGVPHLKPIVAGIGSSPATSDRNNNDNNKL